MKTIQRLINIMLVLIMTLLIMLGTLYALITNEQSARFIVLELVPLVSSHLKIEQMEGKLTSIFSLKNISYQDNAWDIHIETLTLDWNPRKLLQKQFAIKQIAMNNVTIKAYSTQKTTATLTMPTLPTYVRFIDLKHIQLNNIRYIDQQRDLSLETVSYQKMNSLLYTLTVTGMLNNKHLKGQANITYGNNALPTIDATFSVDDAILRLAGEATQETLQATWQLTVPSLHAFLPDYRGDLHSQGTIRGTRDAPVITGTFRTKQLSTKTINVDDIEGNIITLKAEKEKHITAINIKTKKITSTYYPIKTTAFNIVSTLTKNTLTADIKGNINRQDNVAGRITLPIQDYQLNSKQSLSGKLDFNTTHVNQLNIQIPDATIESGTADIHMQLSGNIAKPLLSTDIAIRNTKIAIKSLGIHLDNITLQGKNRGENTLDFTGHFSSGKGTAAVTGQIDLSKPYFDVTLKVKGSQLTLANVHEYKINISPDASVRYQNNNLTIDGDITVPFAKITPMYLHNITSLPTDVVFVNQQSESSLLNALNTHLRITIEKEATVHYETLKASITGSLLLLKTKNRPFTATGVLSTLHGEYTAYGKPLDIQEGRLIYAGNLLSNPGLTIKAIKQIDVVSTGGDSPLIKSDTMQPTYTGSSTITIGITVYGTLDNPIISFFADPAGLSQEDILSYLLFGYPRSGISNTSSMLFLNNALASAKTGINPASITDGLQKNLGLSDVGIKTLQYFDATKQTTDSATTLSVSKSLGPRLSLHYSVGLFQPVSVLTARFKLTKSLLLQAETNMLENGVDLVYEIEKE